MGFLRRFWDAAVEVTPSARPLDFADLWEPFLSGQGPAPGYVAAKQGDMGTPRRGIRKQASQQ
ncbi:hypothetical protein ABZ016_10125 [Streptomyces sp. NPDC006372]|uniref:hypothetical protein n=1 Tax=Streptomyces sp. NPDC006372 TaxID=3155599 RepID=UPI0033B318D2